MPQTINVSDTRIKTIPIGRQGENSVNQITFDFKDWYDFLGEGIMALTLIRPNESTPYPVTLSQDGTNAVWNVSVTDTAIEGVGKAQLLYLIDGKIKKSRIYNTKIFDSIDDGTEPPDPYESWLTELLQIANDVQANAEEVELAKSDTLEYKNSAEQSASNAEQSALNAERSAESAESNASSAETSASNAATSESNAQQSAQFASTSASNASTSASNASTSASNAKTSEDNAKISEDNASESASNAQQSAESARQSAEQAEQIFMFTDDGDGNIIIVRTTGGN